jgi:DNA-binding CsgD family transcriptional regulator
MTSASDVYKIMKAAFSNVGGYLSDDELVAQYLGQVQAFDSLSRSQISSIVFSYSDFRILYVSPSAAAYFGAEADAIKEKGSPFLLQFFSEYHRRFAAETADYLANAFATASGERLLNTSVYYVNWRITNGNGHVHQSLFHVFPVLVGANNEPQLGMYLIYDIKPFIQPDCWWVRLSMEKDIYTYHCEEPRFSNSDLFSAREKEVLSLLQQGHTSKEIASRLHVSSNTVDNHRRRMLQRSGAVDTTALIHLSKLTGVL